MKTILFILSCILFGVNAQSQVSKVNLQASGLTCSMCSNSINKALKTLDFVDKIDANIKTSTFEISFKPGANVDFDKLKKKVEDAGFSVAKFVATIRFNNIKVKPNEPVSVGNKTFQFVSVKENLLNGDKQVKIIDKGFVPSKEYKKNSVSASSKGIRIYNATI